MAPLNGKIPYDPNKPFWKQSKVWAMLVGAAVPILNQLFGWNLDPNTIWQIAAPFITYVIARMAIDSTH